MEKNGNTEGDCENMAGKGLNITKTFPQDVHKMPLQDYYNKHKPKMPKLSKGANTASKETDDAEEEEDEEEEEEEDSPKKDIKTGED